MAKLKIDPVIISTEPEISVSILKNVHKFSGTAAWVIIASFGTYFCMYGFRKPYTAATWEASAFWGVDYKFLMVIAQTSGYVLSKWLGIKIVSEVRASQRIKFLVMLIAFAEIMLLLFALTPRPWNIIFMFLNGIPLGIVFGLVLGFLEGRKKTELLIAGLCASFIVADGVSKSVGTFLLNSGVAEKWMPFSAGILFLLPLIFCLVMLSFVPAPTVDDVSQRSAREPMFHQQRKAFFIKYAPGLIGITLMYLLVTLLRSIRADFATELWTSLGYQGDSSLFTKTELIISISLIALNGFTFLIIDHHKAMRFAMISCLVGFTLMFCTVLGFLHGLPGFLFIVLTGLGVYLPYVAVHTTVFERLIAITKEKANIGFLMYIVDSVGYTGYIVLMLSSALLPAMKTILPTFVKIDILIASSGILLTIYCLFYFTRKLKKNE